MQKSVMVSRNSDVEGDAVSMPSGRGPMVHQFDSVCRNQPTPQIMIQLIGCRIETARPHEGRHQLYGEVIQTRCSKAWARLVGEKAT
jgi:hypothetical protein